MGGDVQSDDEWKMHGDLGPNFGLNYKVGKEFHEWFKMGTRHDLKRQWPAAQTCTTKDYARFYQQSEMLRERHAGNLFEAQGGKLSAALGAHALELEVANAPGEGGSGHYMYRFRMRTELILIVAKLRVQAPNVSAADLADGGVAYAKTLVYAKWGDADRTKLMPGALGYTVWLVQPDGTRQRAPLWPRVLGPGCRRRHRAGLGLDVDGLLPKGERGRFGFPTPCTPPMSTQERKEQVRVQGTSALDVAGGAMLAQLARAAPARAQ